MEHQHQKYSHESASLKLKHEPGKEVLIDFADKKLHEEAIVLSKTDRKASDLKFT